jgi:hypothetical protein
MYLRNVGNTATARLIKEYEEIITFSGFVPPLYAWEFGTISIAPLSVPPEDGDRIQSPKRCIMSRNTITVLLYYRHRLLHMIRFYCWVVGLENKKRNILVTVPNLSCLGLTVSSGCFRPGPVIAFNN